MNTTKAPSREKSHRMRTSKPRASETKVVCSISLTTLLGLGCGAKTGLVTPCSVEVVTAKPEIILVIDRSDSMSARTRDFIPLIDAVRSATSRVIPNFEGAGELGLIFFPATNDGACGGPAEFETALGASTTSVTQAIQRTPVFGMTPTYSAIKLAGDTLRARASREPNRRRFIVIATDGGANCNASIPRSDCRCTSGQTDCDRPDGATNCIDDRRIEQEVRQLRSDGIDTVVIGLSTGADSELYLEFLRTLAIAGGSFGGEQIPYLSAEIESQIENVFTRSLLEPSYCELRITNSGARTPDVLISERVTAARGVVDGNGWDIVLDHPDRIRLRGTLCDHAIAHRVLSWDGAWNQRCYRLP